MKQFLKNHIVLMVSFAAAAISACIVRPDAAYASYIDWHVIICLFCILSLVEAFRNQGVFDRAANALLRKAHSERAVIGALVAITGFISMFATNDMALIMMLPLTAATLRAARWLHHLPFTFIMQGLAANLCGMILPFGNPQNIFLYSYYHMGLKGFLSAMALPFFVSTVLIVLCCLLNPALSNKAKTPRKQASGKTKHQTEKATGSLPALIAYTVALLITFATVFNLIPFWVPLIVVAATLLILDRKALASIDLALLLTFICFFVFSGNMTRIHMVQSSLGLLLDSWPLLTSVLFSQVISNVPSAILLAPFTGNWSALLVGVNIGGAGTLVGSLTSLIVFAQYRKIISAHKDDPGLAGQNAAKFLGLFSLYNVAFLIVLLIACRLG